MVFSPHGLGSLCTYMVKGKELISPDKIPPGRFFKSLPFYADFKGSCNLEKSK